MRACAGLFLLALAIPGCQAPPRGRPATIPFTTGFWFWHGSRAQSPSPAPLDVLYAHAATLTHRQGWLALAEPLDHLPPARHYWLVYRFESSAPALDAVPTLIASFNQQSRQGLPIAGLQLDLDCPTSALPQYARFLRQLRRGLPPQSQLSITALLDWFRPGTAVAGAIAEVDEFVPQFYDVRVSRGVQFAANIAEPFQPAHWGPIFNRFNKPFRIGLATFGRARLLPAPNHPRPSYYFRDVVPADFATHPEFRLETTATPAGETVLTYRAAQPVTIADQHFQPGDAVQFILPNTAAITSAAASVRLVGGQVAGILFFRYPTAGPDLALQPSELLQSTPRTSQIDSVPAPCAALNCQDLYWLPAQSFSSLPVRARIQSSTPLHYFMPAGRVPITLSAPTELRLSLPPYFASTRLYLGRAVSTRAAAFTLLQDHNP